MKLLLFFCSSFTLLGCVNMPAAVDRAEKAQDAAVRTAVWTICYGSSVGAVRRYFNTPELAATWRELCNQPIEFTPEADE